MVCQFMPTTKIYSIFISISVTVLLWTVICLAIAVHLHGLLETSDLSQFILLGAHHATDFLKSSVYTVRYFRMQHESYHYLSTVWFLLLIDDVLTLTDHCIRLACTLLRDRNPISTRIELGCLGLAGVFWLCENHPFAPDFSKTH